MDRIDIFHNGFITFRKSSVTLRYAFCRLQLAHTVGECILQRGVVTCSSQRLWGGHVINIKLQRMLSQTCQIFWRDDTQALSDIVHFQSELKNKIFEIEGRHVPQCRAGDANVIIWLNTSSLTPVRSLNKIQTLSQICHLGLGLGLVNSRWQPSTNLVQISETIAEILSLLIFKMAVVSHLAFVDDDLLQISN